MPKRHGITSELAIGGRPSWHFSVYYYSMAIKKWCSLMTKQMIIIKSSILQYILTMHIYIVCCFISSRLVVYMDPSPGRPLAPASLRSCLRWGKKQHRKLGKKHGYPLDPSGKHTKNYGKWVIYSWFMIYPWKMVIFHGFLYVYQRMSMDNHGDGHLEMLGTSWMLSDKEQEIETTIIG